MPMYVSQFRLHVFYRKAYAPQPFIDPLIHDQVCNPNLLLHSVVYYSKQIRSIHQTV